MGGRGRGRGRSRGQGGNNQQNQNVGRAASDGGDFPPLGSLNLGSRGSHSAPVQPAPPHQQTQQHAHRQQQQPSQQEPLQQQPSQQQTSQQQSLQQQPTQTQTQKPPVPQQQTLPQQGTQPSSGNRSKFPAKKGLGTKGIKMIVDTNHLGTMVKNKGMIIMHYDVDMKIVNTKDDTLKECPKKYLLKAMSAFGKQVWRDRFPAFDGKKNLYSNGNLPCGNDGPFSDLVTVLNPERFNDQGQPTTEQIKVTVKKVNEISLAEIGKYFNNSEHSAYPSNAIQALDVVLRNSGNTNLMAVGRNFFSPPQGRVITLGNGMDLWHGVFQSAFLGHRNLYFNVDVAHKAFPKAQFVKDLVIELGTPPPRYNQPPPAPFDVYNWNSYNDNRLLTNVKNFMKGLKVDYEIPRVANSKRTYRVNDLVKPADEQTFMIDLPNGTKRKETVAGYFASEKRYKVQYPNWPCLHVGSRDRQIYVPMELCRISPNQATIKKLDEEQTRNMVKNAATRPAERRKKIEEAFKSLKLSEDPCMNEFGIRVNDTMEKVEGRVLQPPSLEYKNGREIKVRDGQWRADKEPFQVAGNAINNWGIVDLCGCERGARDIAEQMPKFGREVGMSFINKPQSFAPQRRLMSKQHLDNFLREVGRNKNLDLIFVIIPDYIGGASPYPSVKQILELNNNLLTQCIKMKTANKLNPATVLNILLKINAKTNGINHSIHNKNRPSCFKRPIMIMGADVTHPPPDSKNCPSVAAVTASHDPNALFQYNMQWRLQPPKEEIILDLEEITYEHLRFFAAKNSKSTNMALPERIIFYRDGVSDGQFDIVLRVELAAIKRAVKKMNSNYNPQITFLVVQKRHHTRFFPDPRDKMADRNGNVPPGFVVDTKITHPRDMDFFLVSHQSIQGTARPTKYKVLWDDANMSEDEIEELTYYLCHLFSRCNRSVSYPAPTYYAHLAAFRAKHYIDGQQIDIVGDERAFKARSLDLNKTMIEFNKKHPMFFV